MAYKMVVALGAVALLAMLAAVSADCPPVTTFAPCLPYVRPGGGSPTRGDQCCKLVQSLSQQCLCDAAKNRSPAPGITVDFHKALTLPKACGRAVPPHTTCNGTPVPP